MDFLHFSQLIVNSKIQIQLYSLDSLWRRANAWNVGIWISLRWPIDIINPVDKTKSTCYTSHRRSTTVSFETYPSIPCKFSPRKYKLPIDNQIFLSVYIHLIKVSVE